MSTAPAGQRPAPRDEPAAPGGRPRAHRAPAGALTSTFSWLASCSAAGSAVAVAGAGGLVDAVGPLGAFALAGAGAVGVSVLERIVR